MLLKLAKVRCGQSFCVSQTTITSQIRLFKPHLEKYFQNDVSLVTHRPSRSTKRSKTSPRNTPSLRRESKNCFTSSRKSLFLAPRTVNHP